MIEDFHIIWAESLHSKLVFVEVIVKKLLVIHVTDALNAESISSNGLVSGDSIGLWLGRGSYHVVCASDAHFLEYVRHARSFVENRTDFSGNYVVILSHIDPFGMISLQLPATNRALKRFRQVFADQLRGIESVIPTNSGHDRPISFVMFELWRSIANRTLASIRDSGESTQILTTVCRFLSNPGSEAPEEFPPEVCVHDPSVLEILAIGTAEEIMEGHGQQLAEASPLAECSLNRDLLIAGATHEAAYLLSQMQLNDFDRWVRKVIEKPRLFSAEDLHETLWCRSTVPFFAHSNLQ
ncbi:MAG: hypothetical protein AAFO51_00215, partial [Pseudomonadota bacterium]